jgi:hypothetical protein
MKHMFRTVLVALIAVFALTAIAASPALAAPEWYVKKAGVFKKLTGTETVKVNFEGTFEVSDTKFGPLKRPLAVSCTAKGEEARGEIKSAGTGVISSFETEIAKCKPATVEHNECRSVEHDASVHLPWKTELYTEGSEIRARIVNDGAGTPDWAWTCEVFSGSGGDECGVAGSTHVSNNALGGFAEATFDTKSAKTECFLGKKEAGEWKGVMKVKANQTGVEAIKVE